MRAWTLVLAVAPLAVLSACEISTESLGSLDVRLIAPVDSMVPGEPIVITIVVRNTSVFPVGLGRAVACAVGFDVIDPAGAVLPEDRFCVDGGRGQDIAPGVIGPGDSLAVELSWSGVESPTGTYQLRPYVRDEDERLGAAVPIEVLPSARVQLVHSDPELPVLDFVVGGRNAAIALGRGYASASALVVPGPQVVEIRRTGWATPITTAVFNLRPLGRHVFALRAAPWGPELWLISDPDTVAGPERSELRLIHLATRTPAVVVNATAPSGADPLPMSPLSYGVAWPYVSSDPGRWEVFATTPGGTDPIFQWRLQIQAGQVRTLLLLDGYPAGMMGMLLEP